MIEIFVSDYGILNPFHWPIPSANIDINGFT